MVVPEYVFFFARNANARQTGPKNMSHQMRAALFLSYTHGHLLLAGDARSDELWGDQRDERELSLPAISGDKFQHD